MVKHDDRPRRLHGSFRAPFDYPSGSNEKLRANLHSTTGTPDRTRSPLATPLRRLLRSIADSVRFLCASQTFVSLDHTKINRFAIDFGTPDRTRTCYPRLRRPVLYPDELRARSWNNRAKKRPQLGCGFRGKTILVGVIGFEPTTSWSQTRRATGLRYTPIWRLREWRIIRG